MVRGAGLAVAGALVFSAALTPGHLTDPPRAQPFGPALAIDTQPAIPVHIFEYGFQPSHLEIRVGQIVVWRNIGDELHIVTPTSAAGARIFAQAERLGTVRHRFMKAGRYPYHCSLHPRMRGVVVVLPS